MANKIAILGIDLGKNSCSVVGLDAAGAVVKRRRMRPETLAMFTQNLPAGVIAMEACCGAHHLARLFTAQGHEVRLMSPEYVRPYVKAQKSNDRDAEAIAEATTRPTMRAILPPGSAWCHARSRPAESRDWSGSPSAVINICASCSFMAPVPLCRACGAARRRSAAGCAG